MEINDIRESEMRKTMNSLSVSKTNTQLQSKQAPSSRSVSRGSRYSHGPDRPRFLIMNDLVEREGEIMPRDQLRVSWGNLSNSDMFSNRESSALP